MKIPVCDDQIRCFACRYGAGFLTDPNVPDYGVDPVTAAKMLSANPAKRRNTMILSTEKLSDAFLELNSCGRQFLADRDYKMIRENIEKGTCTIEIEGREKAIHAGNIILFKL